MLPTIFHSGPHYPRACAPRVGGAPARSTVSLPRVHSPSARAPVVSVQHMTPRRSAFRALTPRWRGAPLTPVPSGEAAGSHGALGPRAGHRLLAPTPAPRSAAPASSGPAAGDQGRGGRPGPRATAGFHGAAPPRSSVRREISIGGTPFGKPAAGGYLEPVGQAQCWAVQRTSPTRFPGTPCRRIHSRRITLPTS